MTAPVSPSGFRRGLLLSSAGEAAGLVLLFLETIIAVRLLPTDVFGVYVLLLTTVNFLVMAVDFGCKLSVTQFISSGSRSQQDAIVSTALVFRIAVLACTAALIVVFQGLVVAIGSSPDIAVYIGQLPVMLAAASMDELLTGMLQGFQSYRPMAAARIMRGVLRVLLTAAFLVLFQAGIAALVYSWSLSFAASIAYQYLALPVRDLRHFRWGTLRDLLRFGFPLQLTRLLGFASARLHVTLLALLAGVDSVAYFTVAARIPDALQTLADSYFRVYFPSMSTLLAAGQRRVAAVMFQRSLRLVSFVSALGAVVGAVFSREIVGLLFSDKYAASAPAFALLMLALHMTVLVSVFGYTLTAAGLPGRSLGVDVLRAVATAVGDLLLIPAFGVLGAAHATVLGAYASNPLAAWLVARNRITDGIGIRTYVTQTLILLGCAALGWWFRPESLASSLGYHAGVVALFLVLSMVFSTITRYDLQLVAGGRIGRASGIAEPVPERV